MQCSVYTVQWVKRKEVEQNSIENHSTKSLTCRATQVGGLSSGGGQLFVP